MRFTFLVHPLSPWMLRFYAARNGLGEVLVTPFGERGDLNRFAWREDLIRPIIDFPLITGDTGATCTGQVVGIPTLPQTMLAEQSRSVDMLERAARTLGQGSDLFGLGALSAIVGLRGQDLASRIPEPVTTGNALTCWASAETVGLLMAELSRGTRFCQRVLVVGLPGTLAQALTEVMYQRGLPVEVFHHSYPKALDRFLSQLEAQGGRPIRRWRDLDQALAPKGIVVGAGSIGGELAQANLRPGTAVVDVAQPLDTTPAQRAREDLVIVEGELISMPAATGTGWVGFWSSLYNVVVGQDDRRVLACLAEPMVLCLEQRAESFSLGRRLPGEKVEEMGRMARRQGFGVHALIHERQVLSSEHLQRFASIPWLP